VVIGALLFWPRENRSGSIVQLPQTATSASSATTTNATSTQPLSTTAPLTAETSLTVTSATADSTQLAATATAPPTATAPATTAVPATQPAQGTVAEATPPRSRTPTVTPRPRGTATTQPTASQPEESEEAEIGDGPSVPAFSRAATYRDGGDGDRNERAISVLRRELRGTTTVALRAGGMTAELTRALREEFPDIQFASHADVVIRFTGRADRLGVGRKRRGAEAVVEKNGRVIFRYELPDQVYRVGQNSVEAFASVLGEAFADE